MSKGARAHPPKKKHPKQPRRPPVEPLSEDARAVRASSEYALASMHLAEAERIAVWGQAPNACIHSAYFAMHHCAVSVLFAAGGVGKAKDVPKSHEHVIEHFGKLVEGEKENLKQLGLLLSRARTDRVNSDYALPISGNERASSITADARRFLADCAARWPTVTELPLLE